MHLRSLRSTALVAVSTMVAGALLWSAPAHALNRHIFSGSFGTAGSEAGQLKAPKGIAVNDVTHDLYVVDSGNNRVERFTSGGAYLGQFNGGGTYEVEGRVEQGAAAPTGALANPTRIAIDNSGNPLDPSDEDVYVVDRGHNVIDKFSAAGAYIGQITTSRKRPFEKLSGVAVDTAGSLWVAQEVHETESGYDSEGELIDYSDALVNEFLSSNPTTIHTGSVEGGLAVNSEGRLYVPDRGTHAAVAEEIQLFKNYKYEARLETNLMTDVAVDTSDNEAYMSFANRVEAYGDHGPHSNPLLQVFGEGDLSDGDGIAVDSSTHTVYVADGAANEIAVFGRVIVPDVLTGTEPAEEEQEGSVTLQGTVNPDGEAVTSCQFEYGTEESYGQTAQCAVLPGSGSSPVRVQARVSGLTPLATYHYRLVAASANGTNAGSDQSFIAPVRPSIGEESAEAIVSSAATMRAEIDPGGADTAYRFEYGPTTAYGASVPIAPGDAGAGVQETSVYARAQDLAPSTTYHFRVVIGSAADREVAGPDEQFTTQPPGSAFQLPDGRDWEMVTPPDKHGAGLYSVGYYEGADIQAALGGEAFTWAASAPTEANPAGGRVGETTQVYSKRRSPGAWESLDIATAHTEGASTLAVGRSSEYKVFSEDLSLGLVEPAGNTPLPPLPEGSEKTIYVRDAAGGYRALVSAANVPAGTRFGGDEELAGGIRFSAASPDLSHVVLNSSVALTEGSRAEGGLYEWAGGKLQLADVLPNGTQPSGASLGAREADVRHAISNDGSRLVWEAQGGLYLRDMAAGGKGETVQIDAAQGAPEPKEAQPVFQTASSDDSRVFFTSPAPLTANSTAAAGGEDLYVFELTSAAGEPLRGTLTDLTVDANPGQGAAVQRGVIGAGEDGSYVYFVANGVLGDGAQRGAKQGSCTGSEAPNRTCNLYVEHRDAATGTWDAPVFIATLSSEDQPDWDGGQGSQPEDLTNMTARVSPNGLYLAFMSDRSLTGYANRDAVGGAPDEEVFLYDAGDERLVCASCDPTGAQPVGMRDVGGPGKEPLIDKAQNWSGRWLAASVPGWTSESLNKALYQSRYLSDSGRLYFDSSDALVPADVNGQEDVYQYEPAGVGSCQAPQYGQSASDVFSAVAGGCIGLLSSGSSSEESAFMDASESGGDVFFMTSARLSPQDYDTSYDVYDAHECTPAAPCAAPAPLQPPPCTTGDACKPAPTPQPTIFGSPPSETFSGAGNVAPAGPKAAVTSRQATREQKLRQALNGCRKKPRRTQAKCRAKARRRYGAKSSRSRRKASANRAGRVGRGVTR
ncbi:MAG TPA: NHL repeat-containing protein [Solirubrobacteraceae bacterium]|nr:NHL repeat-containing protein [Solirubrobacteraceae bacterium]